ncbi:DUF1232 domain-containing protein [Demequina sp. B12]|uniref:DUF1232 domain-containing protein n=1 Tax=Demequina sp. B12 TaxID=2992757 RepID=UPI00237B9E0A|nr:DUF1232 domain-containing protein [Demequina sp. B12]MDE0571909.1 DUF1232 domain-containing protein [Demequina sp. B12]
MSWWKFFNAVRRGDHKVAGTTWFTGLVAVLYTLSPVDLLPELLLGPLGFVDDLGLWGVTLMLLNREKSLWEERLTAQAHVVDV